MRLADPNRLGALLCAPPCALRVAAGAMAFTKEQKREQRLERKRARDTADAAAGVTRRPAHRPPAFHHWDERAGEYVADEPEALRVWKAGANERRRESRRARDARADAARGITRAPARRPPNGHRWDERRGEFVARVMPAAAYRWDERSQFVLRDVPPPMPPIAATAATTAGEEAVDVAWALENPVPRLGVLRLRLIDEYLMSWDLVREPWVLRLTGRPLPPYGAGGSNAARSAAWRRAVDRHRAAVRSHERKVVRVITVRGCHFEDNGYIGKEGYRPCPRRYEGRDHHRWYIQRFTNVTAITLESSGYFGSLDKALREIGFAFVYDVNGTESSRQAGWRGRYVNGTHMYVRPISGRWALRGGYDAITDTPLWSKGWLFDFDMSTAKREIVELLQCKGFIPELHDADADASEGASVDQNNE